ncbi:MAG: hypothetical protein SGJ24_06200 [Chloroflexota bacterium]|nr:hypothetical protein [Chloroflexota bacterium]
MSFRLFGLFLLRNEARAPSESLFHEPPRSTHPDSLTVNTPRHPHSIARADCRSVI